jgi:hypothetical protein
MENTIHCAIRPGDREEGPQQRRILYVHHLIGRSATPHAHSIVAFSEAPIANRARFALKISIITARPRHFFTKIHSKLLFQFYF